MPFDARLAHLRSNLARLFCTGSMLTLLLAGCASDYSVEDPNFGASVRQMIVVQTTDPARNARGLDGYKAGAALKSYREGSQDAQQQSQTISAVTFGGG